MQYWIRPRSGWEESFDNKEKALKRAAEIITNDEDGAVSKMGYKSPEALIERWDNLDEMYKSIEDDDDYYRKNQGD